MASTHRQQIRILKQQDQILNAIIGLEKRLEELTRTLETTTVFDDPVVAEPEPEPELTAKEKRDLAKAEKAIANLAKAEKAIAKAEAEAVKVDSAVSSVGISTATTKLPGE